MPGNHFKYRHSDIYLQESSVPSNINVSTTQNSLTFHYPCDSSTTCTPYVIKLPKGQYLLQAYGASGGNSREVELRGKGGFSEGLLRINFPTTIFLYIGGEGLPFSSDITTPTNIEGGYNGGGASYGDCGGGGGATDFRLEGGNAELADSYNTRILIAGGGGGGRTVVESQAKGGDAGGIFGIQGVSLNSSNLPCYGTQQSCVEGKGEKSDGNTWKGADGNNEWGLGNGGGGGGGGYIGGGSCANCAGSGGSGYFTDPIIRGMTFTSNNIGNGYAIIYFFNYFTFKNSFGYLHIHILICISILK